MFARIVAQSFARNTRRKILTAAALVVGMAVATATLTVALEVGDRMAREFRSLGANLLVTPESDTLPVEIGGVDYRPVDEGAYLEEADLGKLKTIFWRHNIVGFTPFLDVPAYFGSGAAQARTTATVIGTWYDHRVPVPDGTAFKTGASVTHPWWKIQGRWFQDGAQEAVVGEALAAKHPDSLAIGKTIYVAKTDNSGSCAPAGCDRNHFHGRQRGQCRAGSSFRGANLSGHPGQFRQLFVSALTKPADALADRDPKSLTPTEYDRWFCSPYISSISYQIKECCPARTCMPSGAWRIPRARFFLM